MCISVNICISHTCVVQRQGDEEPLYIFDHDFIAAAPELAAEYTVPHVFDQDLLQLLGGWMTERVAVAILLGPA